MKYVQLDEFTEMERITKDAFDAHEQEGELEDRIMYSTSGETVIFSIDPHNVWDDDELPVQPRDLFASYIVLHEGDRLEHYANVDEFIDDGTIYMRSIDAAGKLDFFTYGSEPRLLTFDEDGVRPDSPLHIALLGEVNRLLSKHNLQETTPYVILTSN